MNFMTVNYCDPIELRTKLGNRTYDAGKKLLDKDAVIDIEKLSDTAYCAHVKDAGTKVVLFRDRMGISRLHVIALPR